MKVNVILAQDTRYKKKDGTFPIILRLSASDEERTLPIPTGISVPLKDWDNKKREVKSSYDGVTSVTRLNNSLAAKKKNANDILLKLDEAGVLDAMSLMDVKQKIANKSDANSFYVFGDNLVEELKKAKRIGTAESTRGVLNVLRTFTKGKDLKFQDITYRFLTSFETDHYSKGNTPNGLAVYMRTIRSMYNKAIKAGFAEKDKYPFEQYKIKTVPTEKRALEWDILKRIILLDLEQGHRLFHARNYFVASYMMYGMNYTDMAYLEKEHITDGRIKYRRRKTSKLYDIKITPALNKILSYYIALDPSSPFVFPIIKRDTAIAIDKDIKYSRKRYNNKLKEIATGCEIEQNLTSYVSRHSFATQAMLQDVPINAISSMLGHSSLKTTQIYLKSLPNNILDNYNERIMQR
ncbi:MAG: transposase [Bacteroidetes bacterium 43-16]|uniref:site-specific integrase n=1 Tax=uncultured Flavobacterium sp. TaxID=165435 RepID=UPI0009299A9E|nr:site-specific integrase [uncultured Flavobacterium sp.]OJV55757.1 MAG: transposase [Bacteroidetes bacterium 43-16]